MRQFFLSLAFVLGCIVLPVKGSAPEATAQSNAIASVFAEIGHSNVFSTASRVWDPAATEENRQRILKRLFKSIHNYPSSGLVLSASFVPAADLELSGYLFHTLCLKIRLEGPDLIYPHYYSW